jgi:hypothetical protein
MEKRRFNCITIIGPRPPGVPGRASVLTDTPGMIQ